MVDTQNLLCSPKDRKNLVFKKWPASFHESEITTGEQTIPGSTGMLINKVEIGNYKSLDKVYFGPLTSIDVLTGGEN